MSIISIWPQAVRAYITSAATDGEELAIIWFNNTASLRGGPTVITDTSRAEMLTYIPTVAGGETSIGAGNIYLCITH